MLLRLLIISLILVIWLTPKIIKSWLQRSTQQRPNLAMQLIPCTTCKVATPQAQIIYANNQYYCHKQCLP
jgi:hypothetical protein